jgi:hypothetical protein
MWGRKAEHRSLIVASGCGGAAPTILEFQPGFLDGSRRDQGSIVRRGSSGAMQANSLILYGLSRAKHMRRVLISCLVLLLVAPLTACDLFSDDESPTEPPLAARVIVLDGTTTDVNGQGHVEFLGRVLSNGTATARNVRVSVSLFNGSGGLVDVASTTAVPQDLEPQQTGDFKITTTTAPDGYASQTFTVEWDG